MLHCLDTHAGFLSHLKCSDFKQRETGSHCFKKNHPGSQLEKIDWRKTKKMIIVVIWKRKEGGLEHCVSGCGET